MAVTVLPGVRRAIRQQADESANKLAIFVTLILFVALIFCRERKSLPFMESQEPTATSHLKTAWTYHRISSAAANSINTFATNHINHAWREGKLSSGSLPMPQVPLTSTFGGWSPIPSEDNTPVFIGGGGGGGSQLPARC